MVKELKLTRSHNLRKQNDERKKYRKLGMEREIGRKPAVNMIYKSLTDKGCSS